MAEVRSEHLLEKAGTGGCRDTATGRGKSSEKRKDMVNTWVRLWPNNCHKYIKKEILLKEIIKYNK